jgi:hypothetical protein
VTDAGADPGRVTPPAEFEIELTRADGSPLHSEPGGSPAAPTNWRRVVAIASLVGVALGVAIGVLAAQDDGDDGPPAGATTTLGPDSIDNRITTPPTVPPLRALPAPDVTPGTPSAEPQGTSSQSWSLFDQVSVPIFERYDGEVPATLRGFDLDTAIERLTNDVPRRGTTHLELGVKGFVRDYSFVRDVENDRYSLTVDVDVANGVLDESTGTLFWDFSSPTAGEQWIPVDAPAEAEYFEVDTLGDLYDRLLAGPVRVDTISTSEVIPGEFVLIDDDAALARAFTVDVEGAAIPEWQIYALGPTHEFAPSDRPTRMIYTVYVDEVSEIRRVVGLSDLGGIPQLVVHDIEPIANPVAIELPAPETINTSPPRQP